MCDLNIDTVSANQVELGLLLLLLLLLEVCRAAAIKRLV